VSSTEFAVELVTDLRCRRIVFGSGVLLAVAGAALLVEMPTGRLSRLLLMVIWLGDCTWSLQRLWQGWRAVSVVRLSSSGVAQAWRKSESPLTVTLLSGSVVTRRLAWLRFARHGRPPQAELFLATGPADPVWQRLQLIWRLCRESIGQPGVA